MNTLDSTKRFSDRVENYVKYRPRYPQQIVDYLADAVGLNPEWTVADIGSGTGFLTEIFLRNGNRVQGVEPNLEMRRAGEKHLVAYDQFESIDGVAEATNLTAKSVDIVVAGQAFHWFRPEPTRAEFERILKPDGIVALIWNTRRLAGEPFMEAYEDLVEEYADNYQGVSQRNISNREIADFFTDGYQQQTFYKQQLFDYDSLRGRLLSSSYAPAPSHPKHQAMLNALRELYNQYQIDGTVRFKYDTEIYFGSL